MASLIPTLTQSAFTQHLHALTHHRSKLFFSSKTCERRCTSRSLYHLIHPFPAHLLFFIKPILYINQISAFQSITSSGLQTEMNSSSTVRGRHLTNISRLVVLAVPTRAVGLTPFNSRRVQQGQMSACWRVLRLRHDIANSSF